MTLRTFQRSLRRGFLRESSGATAVEFALVVFPLCFMLFAILEVALYFTVDSVLDNAVIETGRLIRTGQAAEQNMTPEQFKERLCSQMGVFSTQCLGHASIDVRVIPQFGDPIADPLEDGEFDPSEASFPTNGQPGDLVLVRVWYEQPLVTSFLGSGLSRLNNGTIMLTATTAFRNEPA